VNDTPVSRALHASGRLPDGLWLETSGPLTEEAVEHFVGRRMLLHNGVWDWSLAHDDALTHLDALTVTRRRLRATGAPWLSVHVGFAAATVAYDEGMQATSPVLERDVLLERMARTVRALQEALDVPVLLENLDDQPSPAYRLYLGALPLGRVRQVHVSGPRQREGGVLVDAHETLRDVDLALVQSVLERVTPWAVTLEYGRTPDALLHDVAALGETLGVSAPTSTQPHDGS